MSSSRRPWVRDVVSVLAAAAVALVARASFADHYKIPSGSMEPTVMVGDQVCVNKLAYGLRLPSSQTYVIPGAEPARGDVVVLASPVDGEVLLKRVVAVPGDKVAVTGGLVSIQGLVVPEKWGAGGLVEELGGRGHPLSIDYGGGPDFGPTTVPDGHFLVLGDNRGNSKDGRYFGWVTREAIMGKAVAVCLHEGRPSWRGL